MIAALVRVPPNRVASGGALSPVLDRLFSVVLRPSAVPARRLRLGSTTSRRWSAEDVLMVIVWVLTMPHAAARFEHYIVVPPFAHLPAGGSFFVASAAALVELTVAAVLARVFAATMRKAVRRAVHRYGRVRFVRETSGIRHQHHTFGEGAKHHA